MKGKVGLVVGLAAGYVLGTRAGRERYEQIKEQAEKVWNLDPVQEKVEVAKDFAKSSVMALPNAVWSGAVKVSKAVSSSGTPGQKLDSTIDATQEAADKVSKGAKTSGKAVKKAAEDTADDVKDAADKTKDAAKKATDDDSSSRDGN